MDDKYYDIDIRDWLERWFDADLTREQEAMLREAILRAREIPDDLADDCCLFMMLSGLAEETEIPEELEARINAALEKEMRASRGAVFRRRVWWAAAGVAVALFGVFITPRLMNVEEIHESELAEVSKRHQIMLANDSVRLAHSEISLPQEIRENTSPASGKSVERQSRHRHRSERMKNRPNADSHHSVSAASVPAQMGASAVGAEEESLYLSAAEERMLAGRNYRVVRDSREAQEILSSVLSNMENNIVVEEAKLSHITVDFENRVGFPAENVKPLNNPYHESKPI